MSVLLGPPRFGGANRANDHDNSGSRHHARGGGSLLRVDEGLYSSKPGLYPI